MIRFAFLTSLFFLISSAGISQDKYVLTVFVKYGYKKSKIEPEVQVNLGEEDLDHPLFGKLRNSGEECVIAKTNGVDEEIICNEADLFEFLFSQNWELIGTTEVKILASPYTQYIFGHD